MIMKIEKYQWLLLVICMEIAIESGVYYDAKGARAALGLLVFFIVGCAVPALLIFCANDKIRTAKTHCTGSDALSPEKKAGSWHTYGQDIEHPSAIQDMHVLVVDDIEINRLILVKTLNMLGASCDIAVNGQEAVEKFEASQPGAYDLILMDVQMPVMDGHTATRLIRSSSHPLAKTLPIIAVTTNVLAEDVQAAIESGMDAHIAKPIQLDKLISVIQEVVDSK